MGSGHWMLGTEQWMGRICAWMGEVSASGFGSSGTDGGAGLRDHVISLPWLRGNTVEITEEVRVSGETVSGGKSFLCRSTTYPACLRFFRRSWLAAVAGRDGSSPRSIV